LFQLRPIFFSKEIRGFTFQLVEIRALNLQEHVSNRVYDVVPLFPRALTNLIAEYAMLGMEDLMGEYARLGMKDLIDECAMLSMEDNESFSSVLNSLKKSPVALRHPRLLENGLSEENKDDQEDGLLPVNAKQAQPKQRRG
jgi:hypothetical protein